MILRQVFYLATACVLVAGACENPFTTREPELPSQNTSGFLDRSSVENVFLNLQAAFTDRNVETYVQSFVDSTRSERRFEFAPDEGVALSQPGIFLGWDLDRERRYFSRMLQATPADSVLALFLVEADREPPRSSTAVITQDYTIVVEHSSPSGGLGGDINGQARFFLERDEFGDWAIYRWEDTKTEPDNFSWSELKAFFN